jgi:hypothetical protein
MAGFRLSVMKRKECEAIMRDAHLYILQSQAIDLPKVPGSQANIRSLCFKRTPDRMVTVASLHMVTSRLC